ncbi:MAG TPA: hypothetical protein VH475_16165 [Tepidisphaeraceae bacterium]|jgi:hypothetical protein
MRHFTASAITLGMIAMAIGLPLAAGCANDSDRPAYRQERPEAYPAGYRYPERRANDDDWEDRGRWDRGYEGRFENGHWDRDDRGYY